MNVNHNLILSGGEALTRNKSSGNNADSTTPDAMENLNDGLDLGVIERARGGIRIDTHSIDCRFVTLYCVSPMI